MSVSVADLVNIRSQIPGAAVVEWFLAVAPYGDPIFTALVNDPGGTIDDPNMTIPYDTSVGENDVEPGMTLWVGDVEDTDNKGRVRIISIDTGANELTVAENDEIEWDDDLYLTCPGEGGFFELWSRVPRIDGTTLYKDYDIAYGSAGDTGDPGGNLKPKANAGPPACVWLNESGYVDVDFVGEDSYTVGTDSITTYTWDFKDGVVQSWGDADHMGTPDSPNVVRFTETGFRYVELSVTSDNGEGLNVFVPVWVFDEGNVDPITDVEVVDQIGTADNGWEARVKVHEVENETVYDFPTGALAVLFTKTTYGGTEVDVGGYHDRENVRMVGWIDDDTSTFDHEAGVVEFTIISHDRKLRKLPGFGFTVEDNDSPDSWAEMSDMNVDRAVQWFHTWHTTVGVVCHLELPGEGSDRAFSIWKCADTNLYEQMQEELLADAMCRVMSDRQGILRVTRDPQYIPTADRDEAICHIMQGDWVGEINADRKVKTTALCRLGGVAGSTPYLSQAPGDAVLQAPEKFHREGYIVQDQDELNNWSGFMLANKNNEFPTVHVLLAGYWNIFDPAEQHFVNLSANDPLNRYDWSLETFVVREVAHRDVSGESTTMTELMLEMETSGPAGETQEIPEVPEPELPDPPPPPPPPPDPPEPPTTTWPEEPAMALGFNVKDVAWTENILEAGGPTWVDVGSQDAGDFNGDIREVVYIQTGDDSVAAWCATTEGVYYTDNVLSGSAIQSAGWSGKLDSDDIDTHFGQPLGTTTIQGIAVYQADPDFCIVTFKGASRTCLSTYTNDRGSSWNYSTWPDDRTLCSPNNLEIDESSGTIYSTRERQSIDRDFYVSTDGGASFALTSGSHIGSWWYDTRICIYKSATGSSIIMEIRDGTPADFMKSDDGGVTWASIEPPGSTFSTYIDPPSIHDINPSLIYIRAGGFFRSTDGGGSWTELTDPGAQGRITLWPGNEDLVFVAYRSSSASGNDYMQYSDDGGTTWYDLTGNWQSIHGNWVGSVHAGSVGVVLLPRVGANAVE